ncbi:MAG: O-antigen ligase family protein [Pirellulales bacterium]
MHAYSQVVLLAIVIVAGAISLLSRWAPPLPWLAIPLLLGFGLAVVQLVPLSAETLARVAPKSFEFQQRLFEPASPDGSPAVTARPISLYPAAGRHQLCLLLLATVAFLTAVRCFTNGSLALSLAAAVAGNGAALVLFGLVQRLTWNDRLFWAVPLSGGGLPFGPFVNRNNAGGFLNMCLAGGVALLFWALRRRGLEGEEDDWQYLSADGFSWWERVRGTVEGWLANLDATKAGALALTGWLVAGVMATLSRGAVVGMLVAGSATLLAAAGMRQRLRHLAALGFVGVVGAALLAWFGFSSDLQERFDTMGSGIDQTRPTMWRESLAAVPEFWATGSGLGTFRYVFEPYRRNLSDHAWYEHAENQYIEAVLDAGAPGLALLLAALALASYALYRLARAARHASPSVQAAALGAVFALSSQAASGAFDFGLYLPANMTLLAVWCGLAVGLAICVSPPERLSRVALPGSAWLCSGVLAGLLAAGVPALLDTWRLGRVEMATRKASLGDLRELPSAEELKGRLDALTTALRERPDDAEAQLRAAELWIMLYRLQAEDRLRAEAEAAISADQVRDAASTGVLHRRAQQLAAAGDMTGLARLRSEPVVAENLLPARERLVRADRACPLLAKALVGLAELTFLSGDPRDNAALLQRAKQLSPADGQLLYHIGALEWDAGRTTEALAAWRESWRLSPPFGERILTQAGERLEPAKLAAEVVPATPEAIAQFVRARRAAGDPQRQWSEKLSEAEHLLSTAKLTTAEKLRLRAALADLGGEHGQAIEGYLQALALRPAEVGWRRELARVLLAQGRVEEARRQAVACAQFAPRDREQIKLMDEIENAVRRQDPSPR